MPLMYVCLEHHSWLPDTAEPHSADFTPVPCILCGTAATLQDVPADGEDPPVAAPPGHEILGPLQGGTYSRAFRARHPPPVAGLRRSWAVTALTPAP